MKCPNCGFNSFEYLDLCKKCGSTLEVNARYKITYAFIEAKRQEDLNSAQSQISKEKIDKPKVSNTSVLIPPSEEDLESKRREDQVATSTFFPSSYSKLPQESPALIGCEELPPFNLAGVSLRIGAFLIDLIILFGVTTITLWVGFYLSNVAFDTKEKSFITVIIPLYLILFFLSTTYFVFLQGFSGKTIGKIIFGIRVITKNGESIGLFDALIRWLGYFISLVFLFVGFIWALFDPKHQAWHDKFAETYVVKE